MKSYYDFCPRQQQNDLFRCRSISHSPNRHHLYYTKRKSIALCPTPTVIILLVILSILATFDRCASFKFALPLHSFQYVNDHVHLNKINRETFSFSLATTRSVVKLHATSRSRSTSKSGSSNFNSSPSTPSSKTTATSTATHTKEERVLINQLNQYKNDIINISKGRYNTKFSTGSNLDMDVETNKEKVDVDTYYMQQKERIIQMLKTFYLFQENQKQEQDVDDHGDGVINYKVYMEASRIIDSALRYCTNEAFQFINYRHSRRKTGKRNNNNYSNDSDNSGSSDDNYRMMNWKRVQFGLDMMDIQLSSLSPLQTTNKDGVSATSVSATLMKQQKVLLSPYDTIPHSVCLQALKALNTLLLQKQNDNSTPTSNSSNNSNSNSINIKRDANPQIQQSNAAFRILQRLCTGIGIRDSNININALIEEMNKSSSTTTTSAKSPTTNKSLGRVQINLDERDFNMVLNGFVTTNQMSQAHRVIALQVRTQHAPPLSPITYSILMKGYGKINDLMNVELCMKQSYDNGIIPDIIMYNSLIDAYVNCNEIELAFDIFEFLRGGSGISSSQQDQGRGHHRRRYYGSKDQPYLLRTREGEGGNLNSNKEGDDLSSDNIIPTPNIRTYNTMLKGFVKDGNIEKAMEISNEMKHCSLWDDITTNTLVSVAVATNEFALAESLLSNYTKNWSNNDDGRQQTATSNNYNKRKRHRYQQHPNVEAYTELLNGYAKANKLTKSLSTLKIMRERGVNPNEYTYTCMISALAKAQKVDEAFKLINFMESSDGIPAGVITYNAFLTGMLEKYVVDERRNNNEIENQVHDTYFNSRLDKAMDIFQTMMKNQHVRPNVITSITLIDALGRCKPSRVEEAKELAVKFDQNGLVPLSNQRVATALIKACANSLDLDGILTAYNHIHSPDTISFNALIDGCCRCGKVKMALEAMADNNDNFINNDRAGYISPDVVTYTILMSAILKIGTSSASHRALLLYNEMKQVWGIMPDRALVDVILTAMISGGNSLGINDEDVRFTMAVLRDAKHLDWRRGELKKRELAVKGVFMGRISEAWKEDEDKYGMKSISKKDDKFSLDPLFKKKKWNQFDSGFSLWGGVIFDDGGKKVTKKKEVDEFLESKKWNDIDSSFRII